MRRKDGETRWSERSDAIEGAAFVHEYLSKTVLLLRHQSLQYPISRNTRQLETKKTLNWKDDASSPYTSLLSNKIPRAVGLIETCMYGKESYLF